MADAAWSSLMGSGEPPLSGEDWRDHGDEDDDTRYPGGTDMGTDHDRETDRQPFPKEGAFGSRRNRLPIENNRM